MNDSFNKPASTDGLILHRLLLLGRFISETGEYGYLNGNPKKGGLRGTYKYAQNVGKRLMTEVKAILKHEAAAELDAKITKERIADISLVLDELVDVEDINAVLEIIKQHKKT